MEKGIISNADISDVLIERPVSFSVKGRHYAIYRPSLGKLQLMSRLLDAVGFNRLKEDDDIYEFSYRTAQGHRDECIRLIAYASLPSDDCLDEGLVSKRIKEFKELEVEDIATILIMIFRLDRTEDIMRHFGMNKDAKQMEKVMKVKGENSKNTLAFGGKSLWGGLIDSACERYGWSYQYVLWGITFSNLRLLLADQVRTVFLTDEERKRVHIPTDSTVIKVDGKDSFKNFIKTQNWR